MNIMIYTTSYIILKAFLRRYYLISNKSNIFKINGKILVDTYQSMKQG
jgi:hypothetical protein